MLWLLAAMLFFANAVYQDGSETMPYPKAVHRLIYGGLCVAPILGALALFGLAERIGQYGWTIERSWAVVAWSFLMLFSLGYVWGIVRRRDGWTRELARVNTLMGIVVAVVMLLANSPVLDFRRISLASAWSMSARASRPNPVTHGEVSGRPSSEQSARWCRSDGHWPLDPSRAAT